VTVDDSSKEVTKRRAPGNGLRQFAMSVMMKVERKGRTTYSEVADELLRDVANEQSQPSALVVHSDVTPQVHSCSFCLPTYHVISTVCKKDKVPTG